MTTHSTTTKAVLSLAIACALGLPAYGNNYTNPTPISIPSYITDDVGSLGNRSKSYFSFNSVAGTSYVFSPERVDPLTGIPSFSADFGVSIYTNDPARLLVASGSAWNTVSFTTPFLQTGSYILEINDRLVGYVADRPYQLRSEVGATGGVPFGPIPGAVPTLVSGISPRTQTIQGGGSQVYTVTLTQPAPAGGQLVTVTSSNTSVVSVPVTLTVPAGARAASFTARSVTVRRNTSVSITTRIGSSSASATLTVTR